VCVLDERRLQREEGVIKVMGKAALWALEGKQANCGKGGDVVKLLGAPSFHLPLVGALRHGLLRTSGGLLADE
jgi:hypothetical protein